MTKLVGVVLGFVLVATILVAASGSSSTSSGSLSSGSNTSSTTGGESSSSSQLASLLSASGSSTSSSGGSSGSISVAATTMAAASSPSAAATTQAATASPPNTTAAPPVQQNGYRAVLMTLDSDIADFDYKDFATDLSLSGDLNCSLIQITILTYSPTLVQGLMAVDLLFVDRPGGVSSATLASDLIYFTMKVRRLVPLTDNYKVNSAVLDPTLVAPAWALELPDPNANSTDSGSGLPRRLPIMGFIGMCIVLGLLLLITIIYIVYYLVVGRHDRDALRYTVDDKKNSTGCSTWVLGSNRTVSEAMKQGQLMGLLKKEDNVKLVACGAGHMVIVSSCNGVFVGGDNYHGQLGLGHNRHVFHFERNPWFDGVEIESVVCGTRHTAIVTVDGELYTFGGGEDGVLGHGDFEDQWTPCRVEYFGMNDNPIKGIASGDHHLVALAGDGLYSWGWNEYGQLMLGDNFGTQSQCSPQWVEYFADYEQHIREIVCGVTHTLVLCCDWELYGCGGNGCGQLGLGHYEDVWSPELIPLFETSTYVHSISAYFHTLVACDDGVYCCGEGRGYKLGLEHQEFITGLTWISALEGQDIKQVYAGNEHSFFAGDDFASVFACGKSDDGGPLGFKVLDKNSNSTSGGGKIKLKKPTKIDLEELLNIPMNCRTGGKTKHSQRQQLLEAEGDAFPSIRQLVVGPEYTVVLVRLGVKLDRSNMNQASKGGKKGGGGGGKKHMSKNNNSDDEEQSAPGKKENPLKNLSNDPTELPPPTSGKRKSSTSSAIKEEKKEDKEKKKKKSKGWDSAGRGSDWE